MSDLISRKAVMDRITDGYQNSGGGQDRYAVGINVGLTKALNVLKDVPSVEAEPVRRGKWIDETFKPWGLVHHPYKCDQCGEHSEATSDFCPWCGAKMEADHE